MATAMKNILRPKNLKYRFMDAIGSLFPERLIGISQKYINYSPKNCRPIFISEKANNDSKSAAQAQGWETFVWRAAGSWIRQKISRNGR
jgi:hypothetical protein